MKINNDLDTSAYNLFVTNGTKSTKGFKLKFDKIIKKNNKFEIYFIEIKPEVAAAVPTYPFCLLKIENLDKFKVYIDNKRKKN